MSKPIQSGLIYNFAASYHDPDELRQISISEHAPMFFAPLNSAADFRYRLQGARVGELLIANCINEISFKSSYESIAPDMLVVNFIDAGQHSHFAKSGQNLDVNRGQVYIQRTRDLRATMVYPGTNQTSVFMPFSRYARLVDCEVNDPVKEFSRFMTVADSTLQQVNILRGISNILSQTEEVENGICAAPLGASLLQEAFLSVMIETWPQQSAQEARRYTPSPRHVKRATEWIHAHLAERIKLEDIATAAGSSVRTLQTGFRKQFGLSPIGYIVRCRLKMVHQELLTAALDRTIGEIANSWGFFHLGDFAAKYKQCYGRSPSETRYGRTGDHFQIKR